MLSKFKTKNRFGFSLFEVCVTMAIVAVFVAACANVFTQKHKKRVTLPVHGRFECYYNDEGKQIQAQYNEGLKVEEKELPQGSNCHFTPPRTASYLIINAVAGGGYGSPVYGGTAGQFKNLFLSNIDVEKLEIYLGKAASNPSSQGNATMIFGKKPQESGYLILSLKGGSTNSDSNLNFKDSCVIAYSNFSCRISPACSISGSNVDVAYCGVDDPDGTNLNAEKHKTVSKDEIMQKYNNTSIADLTKGSLVYTYSEDKPVVEDGVTYNRHTDYFTIALEIDGNYTPNEDVSEFGGYVNSLGLNLDSVTGGIGHLAVPAGNGGAKGARGGDGAVLITW